MFDKTVKTVLTLDPTTGLATAIASSVKEDFLAGTISGIASVFSKNEVVTGIGRTAAVGLAVYATAQVTRKKLVGTYAFNPLAA